VTSQPDHSLADEPMVDEPLPDQFGPTGIVIPAPLPADPLPPEPSSEEGASGARPSLDPGQAGATTGRRFGNNLPEPVVIGRHTERADSAAVAGDTEPDDTEPDDTEPDGTDLGMHATTTAVTPPRLTGQWHDIQAMFVDDPQGSVQRAAQVVDASVNALAESLRQRQAALGRGDTSNAARNTEQLREALVDLRVFYERLAALVEELGTE
jgi:hypothetical protein